MKKWIIYGNKELSGVVNINGSKNSLLAILAASIITKSIVELENVTPIKDTYMMISILRKLNVIIIYDNKSKMIVDARKVANKDLVFEEMGKLRASYYLIGALLSLYSNVKSLGPGGCGFATRPIDLHLFAFQKLGFSSFVEDNLYIFKKDRKIEKTIVFDKVSVGATVNAILASARVRGKVKLVNVAIEPEIDDLIAFLNKCGANIKRKDREINIVGNSRLVGCTHKIIQDRIEAGTYLILGACLGNNLRINYSYREHISSLLSLLENMKIPIEIKKDEIIISKRGDVEDFNLIFDAYPQLPTDLQQPISILLSRCSKWSFLKDKVYPSRYTQLGELNKMGFIMEVEDDVLRVKSSKEIKGACLSCKDLRGGASLVLASLIADGKSEISDVWHIERGYYDIINKLRHIGAMIYEEN